MNEFTFDIENATFDTTDKEISDGEYEYYQGTGMIEFFVQNSHPKSNTYEFERGDCVGCAEWLIEGFGLESGIEELGVDLNSLSIGCTYTISEINVDYIRGDGWTTDDDEDWTYGSITKSSSFPKTQKEQIKMWMWNNFTHKIKWVRDWSIWYG